MPASLPDVRRLTLDGWQRGVKRHLARSTRPPTADQVVQDARRQPGWAGARNRQPVEGPPRARRLRRTGRDRVPADALGELAPRAEVVPIRRARKAGD